MSGSTSVPSPTFGATGFVAPTEAAILAGVQSDINAAFGGNLNSDLTTPQGQIAMSTAAIVGDQNSQMVALFNGVDPAYASGRMQDAIGRIYFLTRNPAQSTVLQIACVGLPGVSILVGALVIDGNSNQYYCTSNVIIPSGGTITTSFAAVETGPLPVPSSVTIYRTIAGWDAATVVSGVVGNVVESRAAFEARRASSVAANGAGFLPAIAGAVAAVPNVVDYYVTENSTNTSTTIGGVSIAANSLYVCVSGGTSAAVAQAIWSKKNPGCSYTGNTSVTVYDTNSGYSYPYPSYTVTYETPTAEPFCMVVTIKNSATVPSNAAALIQAAIVLAFLGEDGGARARIGSLVFASRYYAGVASLGAWAQIISILIGTNASPTASFTGSISGNTLTVSSVTGTIAIGQFVYGTGVASGTQITAGSGTSWAVAISQTVSSEALTSVAASLNDYQMNINQIPTLAAADIAVVLV